MNNVVFDKTMENVRNHVDVRLLTRWDRRYGAKAMITKVNFHSSVFSENLVVIKMRKLKVKFNKPIYVDMCMSSTYPRRVFMNFITSTCYHYIIIYFIIYFIILVIIML